MRCYMIFCHSKSILNRPPQSRWHISQMWFSKGAHKEPLSMNQHMGPCASYFLDGISPSPVGHNRRGMQCQPLGPSVTSKASPMIGPWAMVETDPYVGLDQIQIYQIKVPFGDVKPILWDIPQMAMEKVKVIVWGGWAREPGSISWEPRWIISDLKKASPTWTIFCLELFRLLNCWTFSSCEPLGTKAALILLHVFAE